jgi:O-antigen ligase
MAEGMRAAIGAGGAAVGRAAVCAAALAVPVLYAPGLESPFAEPKLAVVLVTGALVIAGELVAFAAGVARPRWDPFARAALLALLGTTALAAAFAIGRGPPGAPYARAELGRLVAMLAIAAGAARAAADARWRSRLVDAIAVSAGAVALLGLLQHLRLLPFALPVISVPGSTFGNRNMAGEAVAMSIPFSLAALRFAPAASGRTRARLAWPIAALLVLELVYLAVTRTRGAWLGGALGLVVFVAVRRPALSRGAWLAAPPVAGAVLLAALVPGRSSPRDARDVKRYEPGAAVMREAVDPLSPVARTRVGLWRRTLALYAEHPATGIGPGNFPISFPRKAEPGAARDGVMSPTVIPRRPHDELLERLAETGPLGLAALLAVYLAAVAAARRWQRAGAVAPEATAEVSGAGAGAPREAGTEVSRADAAAAAAGSLAAGFACGLTAFPLGMPATTLLSGVALGLLGTLDPRRSGLPWPRAVRARSGPQPPSPPSGGASWGAIVPAMAIGAIVVAGAALGAWRGLAASYFRGRAERALAARDAKAGAAEALRLLARADGAGAEGATFWIGLRTAQAALRLGDGAAAVQAAERALALEPWSPHALALRGAGRLAAGDAPGAADDARRALELYADHPVAQATLAAAAARLGRAEGL